MLRLQPYEFQVVHIAGKFNIADPLSRLLGKSAKSTTHHHGAEEYVRFVAVQATPSALTTREVERASAEDDELTEVRTAIKTGRFEKCAAYARIANELCVVGQLVLRGTRIVLPRALRNQALALAHEGHLGMVGTKQHLRGKVWWPGMYGATEKYVKSCHGCQLVARPDVPEPLRPTALPDGPWQDIATDLLGPLPTGHSILVAVDYYSRYYEYEVLRSTTAEKVIDCLENIFSRHGLPISIRSDCGPQFQSSQFQNYCLENGIQHVKTTPKWAQANGEVERQNASIMKRIRIAQAEGLDWQRELRKYVTTYRSIEHSTTGRSPAELLFNRKLRGKLPDISTPRDDIEARDTDADRKGKAKEYADERRGAKSSSVQVGDEVLLKQDRVDKFTTTFNHTPHTIVSKNGKSVVVQSPTGAQYSRNTTHVKVYTPAEQTLPPVESGIPRDSESRTELAVRPQQGSSPSRPLNTPPVRPRREGRLPQKFSDFIMK